jgi:hypothetical protein
MASSGVSNAANPVATEPSVLSRRILGLLPGIVLLAIVGYAGKFIEHFIATYGKAHHLVLPNIEYVLWAILLGLLISNTVGVAAIFRSGVATYEFWLKTGIVLLGARFLLGDVGRLGGLSLVLIVIELVLALSFMTYLGRAFKLRATGPTVFGLGLPLTTRQKPLRQEHSIPTPQARSQYSPKPAATLPSDSSCSDTQSTGHRRVRPPP